MIRDRILIAVALGLGAIANAGAATSLGADGYPRVFEQPAGADAFLNIEYLPEWRYSGDKGARRDAEMLLDLWVPKGKSNCPLVVYVHGGAYSEGMKRLGQYQALADRLIARGIAFGAMNYILKPRRIRPQVWYDYRDAARYLRMHAETYRLDPTAFGALGISAGGWLISNAGHGTGDVFSSEENGSCLTIQALMEQDFTVHQQRKPSGIWAPLQNDRRDWPQHYGRWQAIAFDFSHLQNIANSWSPAMCDIVGAGAPASMRQRIEDAAAKARKQGGEQAAAWVWERHPFWARLDAGVIDYSYAEMLAPKYAGKNVHVPPLALEPGEGRKRQNEHSLTRQVVGEGEALLAEVLARWFEDRLRGANARAPVPEIWPGLRIVDAPVEVSMVAPAGVTIHYTTDGSEPTASSPTYAKPFTVQPGTVVKAIGIQAGKKPSGAMVATFVTGPVPPTLENHQRQLPPGTTGQPYSHTFQAADTGVTFYPKGDLVPRLDRKTNRLLLANGMSLDPTTGVWSGTPTTPGRYWVQIAVNRGPGTVCRLYDCTWEVTGEPLAPATATPAAGDDTNVVVLRLADLDQRTRQTLEARASQYLHIDLVIEDDGTGAMLLVPERQTTIAKRALLDFFGGTLPDGARWEE